MFILDLIPNLKRTAATNGGEYAGPCFFCGGKDRFRVWPNEGPSGRFWCRACHKHGDGLQLIRDMQGLTFAEALKAWGLSSLTWRQGTPIRPTPTTWTPREATGPGNTWQEKAGVFLDKAIKSLWSPRGDKMRVWLRTKKGLSDATIKAADLGYNPKDIYEPRAIWGLEPSLKEDGTERRQWIPAGLVIPLIVKEQVLRLRIRRNDLHDASKYIIVSGSSSAPMAWGEDKGAAVIVESELDGMLLNQEAGDLVTVIALGSAQGKPDRITHDGLMKVEIILVSLDADGAGAKASWQFWPETYGKKAKRWPCVGGKDPSAARLRGLDLRAWVVAGIFETEKRFERFCIQTVDGWLSDAEAIKGGSPC